MIVGPLTGGSAEPKLMEFVYDALGRRVETIEYIDSATGVTLADPRRTRHVYFGLEVIQEYTCGPSYSWCGSGPELVREFVHGDPARYPEVVAMIEHHGTGRTENVPEGGFVYHYLHDVLGSVIGLTDETGLPRERYTYDPYGRPFLEYWDATANGGQGAWVDSATSTTVWGAPSGGMPYSRFGNPFGWTGHRYDAAVGLYHTKYRSYEPVLGRWLQRDPEEYIDGVNLYEYAMSSPIGLTDPLGTTSGMPKPSGSCPSDDYKQDKCRAAANKALNNCLKSEKAGGPSSPSNDDCFETFSQSMDACARGKPGTHDKEVKRGFEFLDCMGRCLESLNAAQISIGAGIGSQIPIPKNIGGIQVLRGPGWGKSIDVMGGGLADRLPGGLRDSVGSQLTRGLKGIRAAGTVQGGIIISGGVALSFEAYCAVRCGINNRAY